MIKRRVNIPLARIGFKRVIYTTRQATETVFTSNKDICIVELNTYFKQVTFSETLKVFFLHFSCCSIAVYRVSVKQINDYIFERFECFILLGGLISLA